MTVQQTHPIDERVTASPRGRKRRLGRFVVGHVWILCALTLVPVTIATAEPASAAARVPVSAPREHLAQELPEESDDPDPGETTVTSEGETSEGEETGPSGPSPWQWILLVSLVAGAVVVVARSRQEGAPQPPPVVEYESVLERYRQVATAVYAAPGSPDEVTYQLGVLDGLSARLDGIILHTTEKKERVALLAVHDAVHDLENQLRAANTGLNAEASAALTSSAGAVLDELDQAIELL